MVDPGLEVHWADVPAFDVSGVVTTPLRTVINCARAYPFDVALTVADSALRSRQVTLSQLLATAERSPRTGRRAAIRVARQADQRAANRFEFHSSRDDLRRDVRRYAAFVRLGYVVVRFTWEEVMFGPDCVRAVLIDVVERETRRALVSSGG